MCHTHMVFVFMSKLVGNNMVMQSLIINMIILSFLLHCYWVIQLDV